MTDVKYLDEERLKLWDEVTKLKDGLHDLSTRTPEELKQARQNSKETSMFRNKTKTTSEEAAKLYLELSNLLNTMQNKATDLEKQIKEINVAYDITQANSDGTSEIYEEVKSSLEDYNENLKQIEKDIEDCQSYLTKSKNVYEQIQQQSTNSSSYEAKIISSHKKILELHQEISELYNEIFGYEEDDEDEVTETKTTKHVDGLKDELDNTYNKLKTSFGLLNTKFENLKKEKFDEIDKDYAEKIKVFEELQRKIESLLPGAMSAGLSSAYYAKRQNEIKERDKFDKTFIFALIALTLISCIPFGLGIYLFFAKGFDIQTIIIDTPRTVLATLPLYAPAMWLAYSSNRKSNLSKRLIEEYTHKEALSKTFEGLAKQIENLGDDEISNNLRIKLLYNMVSMSSENPGSLIKGYNKSDHPFMDIIDKSTNLTNALEKLSHFPGIKNIAASILGKVETHQEEKIKKGLATNYVLSEDEE